MSVFLCTVGASALLFCAAISIGMARWPRDVERPLGRPIYLQRRAKIRWSEATSTAGKRLCRVATERSRMAFSDEIAFLLTDGVVSCVVGFTDRRSGQLRCWLY